MAGLHKPLVVVPVHTRGEEKVIGEPLARLPNGVQGTYSANGRPVAGSRMARTWCSP